MNKKLIKKDVKLKVEELSETKPVNKNNTKIIIIIMGIVLAAILAYYFPIGENKSKAKADLSKDLGKELSLVEQKKTSLLENPRIITKIYLRNNLIGVLHDKTLLDKALEDVYQERYVEKFPESKIGLGEDVYIVDQESYYEYENIDEKLINYLDENSLFSILTNKISFSNGAVIYVKDLDMFTRIRERFLLNFINEDTYRLLQDNKRVTPLNTYGEQDLSLKVRETMSVSQGLASEDRIFTTEEEIINFFNYGYDTIEKKYYTTVDGDTVAGVASIAGKNLSAQQLIILNSDQLVSEDQLLAPGTKLNVTYFQSPINIEVVKERLAEEYVYPEPTKYIYDDTMEQGKQVVVSEEVIGRKNVRYHDTYINGILTDGEVVSEVETIAPVQKVVRVGTRVIVSNNITVDYNTGSATAGSLWYPVKNPKLICGFYCYPGHIGADFQDRYNLWGVVYASEEGVIMENSYTSFNGYYVTINHGGGLYTYYGHMRGPGFYGKGTHVSKGEAIGNIGMTGFATAPHVHFMVSIGSPYFNASTVSNPCNFLGC